MRFQFVLIFAVVLWSGACSAEDTLPTQTLDKPATKGEVKDLRTRTAGEDWPEFLGPRRNSTSTEKGILTDWPQEGPRLVWKVSLGDGYGAPVTSRGRLFQFHAVGDKEVLMCLNAETGQKLWEFAYDYDYDDILGYEDGPRCSPLVDGDRVYIYGVEGMLHCVNIADGKPLWRVNTQADYGFVQNFFGVGSTPVIDGDLIICQVGGSPPGSPETYSGRVKGNGSGIVAFDKLTGKEKYRLTDELASYSTPQLATIGERRWCFVLARGGLVAFEPTSGKVDFEFPWRAKSLESVNASRPVVVGDRVFISETYGPGSALLAVEPGKYEVVWKDDERKRHRAMQTHWNTAVHHDGYLYACSGRHTPEAELRCIELATGKVMWSQPGLTRSSLLYVDGHFVCISEDGVLRLLKANPQKYDLVAEVTLRDQSKAEEWKRLGLDPPPLLKYPAWEAPVLSHGLLYVRGSDALVCLELIPERAARSEK